MEPRDKPVSTSRIILDPKKSARAVGLNYVSDEMPGIRRKKVGNSFGYFSDNGKTISGSAQIRRINALAIPPAWTEVWICPDENGHLQATGRDGRGRKQHRYHKRWREVRDETKFNRMVDFAKALPKIRRIVRRDLKLPGVARRKVLATIVRLLEVSLIRVGNEEYARTNKSFGLTTMQDKHVAVNGSSVRFQFRGKSNKHHIIEIENRPLAKIIKRCQELPGQDLFQYIDSEGRRQDVKSDDVNNYLREISGKDFTAKDFRTWAGTVLAATFLRNFDVFQTQAEAKKNLLRAVESVAERLGNTPAICRKCYVHPVIFDSYFDGFLVKNKCAVKKPLTKTERLQPEESAVLRLLQSRLSQKKEPFNKTLQRSLSQLKKRKRRSPQRQITTRSA